MTPVATRSDIDGKLSSVSLPSESACDDHSILRNEATDEPDDLGGWGRLPKGDAPGAVAAAPGSRWTSQRDPSHPLSEASRCDDLARFQRNEHTLAPHDPRDLETESPAGLAASVKSRGQETLAGSEDNPVSGAKNVIEPANANDGNPRGDESKRPRAAVLPPEVAHLARLLVPMDKTALDRLSDAERKARRWAMYRVKRKLEMG
jgi:hypothetical protein